MVVPSYTPTSVSRDLDVTHLLVCKVNQDRFLKVDCGYVRPTLILRQLALLLGLYSIIFPVPDIYICERQSFFTPVLQFRLLSFCRDKDCGGVSVEAQVSVLAEDPVFS